MKTCTKCKKRKRKFSFSLAYGTKKNKDGLKPRCKACVKIDRLEIRRSKKGLVQTLFDHHLFRSKEHKTPLPKYTKKDLKEWLFSQKKFHHLYQLWENSNFDKMLTPSVDRKNDYLPYSFSNIQIVTWDENFKKGHTDRKAGINNKQAKSIKQYSQDGNLIDIFYSINQAARSTGFSKADICNACQGKRKTVHGYIFKYLGENNV